MDTSKPSKVRQLVGSLAESDKERSANRARINTLLNGEKPFTEQEADEAGMSVNVNFLEAHTMASDARSTFENAFQGREKYFSFTFDDGPPELKEQWGKALESRINKLLRRSAKYQSALTSKFAEMVLHGPGTVQWETESAWCPSFVPIDRILFPNGSFVDLSNVTYFAIRREYTPSDLMEKIKGDHDPGWNEKMVKSLCVAASEIGTESMATDRHREFEQLVEDYKSAGFWYSSDKVSTIKAWDFFHIEDGKWHRKVIADAMPKAKGVDISNDFLFDSKKRPVADKIGQIIHINYANGANVPPFRYHSIRSLGWLIYGVCHLSNRIRCRFFEAVFEHMLMWFRLTGSGTDKPKLINLGDRVVIPNELTMVTSAERHQVDDGLVVGALGSLQNLMTESASSYRKDIDQASGVEETATKTMARMNASSAMVGSMLGQAYKFQLSEYEEIVRRLFREDSSDDDAKKIQEYARRLGIPREMLDMENITLTPDRVVGGGSKMLEIQQTDSLMAISPKLDPSAQRSVLRMYVQARTDDAQRAVELVPYEKPAVNDSMMEAQLAIGSLMQGIPIGVRPQTNHIDYLSAMVEALVKLIQKYQAVEPEVEDVLGLETILHNIQGHLEILAQDETQRPVAKLISDDVTKLAGAVQSMKQEVAAKQQEAGRQISPETQAKLMEAKITAEAKAQIKMQESQQKMAINDAKFQNDQSRKFAKLATENEALDIKTAAEIQRDNVTTAADVARENAAEKAKVKNGDTGS